MKRWIWLVFVVACGDVSTNGSECGDAFVDPGEQCDDGNLSGGDGCSAVCTTESPCGNGRLDTGEQCDDGNTVSADGCSATCTNEPRCGDNRVDAGEQCDDGNATRHDGCSAACVTEYEYTYSASWSLRTIANTVVACPTGYNTAAVYSQEIDNNGAPIGSVIIDLFDCAAGTGTTASLWGGRYKVWIEITNATNTAVYAKSTSAILDLNSNGKSFVATIYTDGGYFAWAWNLIGANSNNALTCAQANAAGGVELVSTLTSSTTAYSDIFDCNDYAGITAGLPAGTYTVSAAALNASDQSIGTAPALTNRQITGPNNVTDLGTITIPITGL